VDDHRLTTAECGLQNAECGTAEVPPAAFRVPSSAEITLADRPGPMWRLVLMLTWPALVQQLLVLSVSFSDRLLAGRFQHLEAADQLATQAAQTSANYLLWFISSYIVLVSVGSTAVVARMVGGGDRAGAVHITNQSLLLGLVLGVAGGGLGLALLPALVRLLGLHGPAADFASAYLWPLFLLLPFQVVEQAGIACLVGAGDTRTGPLVLAGVAVINLPLAWLFFGGLGPLPGLGFPGIALGTALSHTLGALAVLAVLARGRAGLRLRPRLLWPSWPLLWRVLRVSVPAAADSLSLAVGQLWFIRIVNGLGDAASGAHGIALYWEALGYLSGAAFGTAAMALVGQCLGAAKPERAAQAAWTTFVLSCGVMSLMGAVFFTLAVPMFWLFCPLPEQAPIVAAGVPVLRLVAFAMPPLASTLVFTAALRGAGDTRVPVLFTWLGFFLVRIPLAYLLIDPRLGLGLLGAWLAMFADLVVRGAFFLMRFAGGRWRRMRV
jgi:putative MATE family efflux protein